MASRSAPPDDPRALWRALRSEVLADERRREVAAVTGLSFAKVRALRRLADAAMSQRDLAAALTTDPPYVTVIVRDLERRGLVTRRPSPDDGRVRLVSLTPAGLTLARRAEEILDRPPDWLTSLTAAERAMLAQALGDTGARSHA